MSETQRRYFGYSGGGGDFVGFSPRRGDTLHRRSEIWREGVDQMSTSTLHFTPSAQGGWVPKKT